MPEVMSWSPLRHLPEEARNKFIDGLVFTDSGLASYRFDVLREHLNATQKYEVMALFGRQFANTEVDKDQLSYEDKLISSLMSCGQVACIGDDYLEGMVCVIDQGCQSLFEWSRCSPSECDTVGDDGGAGW